MDKKNLYKEEDGDDDDLEEEEEEIEGEEDEEAEEEEEEAEESVVDFGDMVIGTENNTGINFHKLGDKNENKNYPNEGADLINLGTRNNNFAKSNSDENNINFNINQQNAEMTEDHIKDKIDLLDLDLESMPKDDLINLLLKGDEQPVEKKKNKFKLNPRNPKPEMENIYTNMQHMAEVKDPELNQDFNVALTKVLSKMMKESNNPNQEVFDILLADRDKIEEELQKYEFSKKTKIDEKIKNWIDKKNRSLEVIQEKLNEDFQKVYTFTPNVGNSKNSMIKRNFGQFLEDQENHKKKIKEKLDMLRENKLKESINNYQTAPKINQISKKIAENKLKNDQVMNSDGNKVHERLYKKRNQNLKASMLKSPSNFNSKVNNKKVEERTKILYQDAINRQVKQKESQKNRGQETIYKSNQNSNKFILKKFKAQYKEEVEKLIQENVSNSNEPVEMNKINFVQLNVLMQNLNFITKDEPEKEVEAHRENTMVNNPLSTKNQERRLMVELYENLKDNDGLVDFDHLFIFCLSILNLLEYFVVKSYKGEGNQGEVQQMAHNSSQKTLKSSNSNPRLMKKTNSVLTLNDESMENLIHKLNLELNSRILVQKKYGGIDEENNFIITFNHAKLIFKDFNLFAFNYNSAIYKNKQNKTPKVVIPENNFKPKINPKSAKLGNNYRQKVINQYEIINLNNKENDNNQNFDDPNLNEVNTLISNNIPSTKARENNFSPRVVNRNKVLSPTRTGNQPQTGLDFVDVMIYKKIKKEKMNEKIREEKEIKELENCTFKPKINNYQFRDNVISLDKQQRLNRLYQKGTETLINKKNKTKDDLDVEKYGAECTFKPIINDREVNEIFDENKNQIFYDKDVMKYNERMRRGRIVIY